MPARAVMKPQVDETRAVVEPQMVIRVARAHLDGEAPRGEGREHGAQTQSTQQGRAIGYPGRSPRITSPTTQSPGATAAASGPGWRSRNLEGCDSLLMRETEEERV